jgi:hypothetical protein
MSHSMPAMINSAWLRDDMQHTVDGSIKALGCSRFSQCAVRAWIMHQLPLCRNKRTQQATFLQQHQVWRTGSGALLVACWEQAEEASHDHKHLATYPEPGLSWEGVEMEEPSQGGPMRGARTVHQPTWVRVPADSWICLPADKRYQDQGQS